MMRNFILACLVACLPFLMQGQDSPSAYAVQLAAFNGPVSPDYFEDFDGVYFLSVYGGTMYKYFTKDYTSKDEAMQVAQKAKQAGHANAKVVNMTEYRAKSINCCDAPGETVSVKNIFFDFDRSDLRSASKTELDNVVEILRKNPAYTVEVRAHTDAKGSDAYNMSLSGRRRDAAVRYLRAKNISEGRITTSTHGEKDPVAINETKAGDDSPEGRQYNRRVELIIRDPSGSVKAADTDFVPSNLKQ
jgi:outer membrane protein OmpA-like peptidoglycan-associated protein